MKKFILIIVMISAILIVTGIAKQGEADEIYGCYKKNNGQLRIVDSLSKCHPLENPIILNATDSGFTTGNLAGEWILFGSDLQDQHTWKGSLIIDSTGTVTCGTLTSSDGQVNNTYTGINLTIDVTGKVTGIVQESGGVTTQLTMQMDRSKSIMAGVGSNTTGGEDGVFVLIKK